LREHYDNPSSVLEAQIEEQQSLMESLQFDCTRKQDQLQEMQDVKDQCVC
jgi:hypothetical protein